MDQNYMHLVRAIGLHNTRLVPSGVTSQGDRLMFPLISSNITQTQAHRLLGRRSARAATSAITAGDPPPAGAHFSSEWGFTQLRTIWTTTGDWNEYTPDILKGMIEDLAGEPNLEPAKALAAQITPSSKPITPQPSLSSLQRFPILQIYI
jgi:hypothetical protein